MRTLRVLGLVVLVGCSTSNTATETGGAPGGGQGGAAVGGSAGTTIGGSAGNGLGGAGGAAGAGTAGQAAGGAAGASAVGGAAGKGSGGVGGAAGAAGQGAAGAAGAPADDACGTTIPPAASMCDSLTADGPCVVPNFVTGGLPSNIFPGGGSSTIFGSSSTYHLTAVTIYDDGSNRTDAGAGFTCEGSGGIRETINIEAGPYLHAAFVETGFATYTSVTSGPLTFTSQAYGYEPACSSGPLGASNVTTGGRWAATTTTATLEGFGIACVHGGKVYSGTEVDTFTLVP